MLLTTIGALIVTSIALVALADLLRLSFEVNTILAVQMMTCMREGQKTVHGPIEPRPGTGLFGRILHHIHGRLMQMMMRRAYFRGAPIAAEIRQAMVSHGHLSDGPLETS
jgi:hypothetical protein